jgi:O-6-methylguanine DNA methyltransferase
MNTTPLAEWPETRSSPRDPETGPVVGVRTTRIYCRTVCRPGRAPRPENCVPFLNAAAAREAGYRACKQCRPDDAEPPARLRNPAPARPVTIRYGVGPTPVGFAFVAASPRGICALYLLDTPDASPALARLRREFPGASLEADAATADAVIPRVVAHLTRGQPCHDLPLDLHGTPFQLRVWEALRAIPRGQTLTYGALAGALGLAPVAARAVGTACGANPVSLVVPCHRVVRSGGGLGGYYWGLDRKRALLDLERAEGQRSSIPRDLPEPSRTAVP